MYSEIEILKLKSIHEKLDTIYMIVERHGGIVKALEDKEGQPAILMLLIATAEQFNKLNKNNSTILNQFDKLDIKGIISIRNFIAHDYDGVNLAIVENSLRYGIPEILAIVKEILNKL